ncbi:hypothetical protein [Thermosporothrix hazakensis]|uniref:hypothetical protein n=1 Tax=Thermosporothrix hazakensis TaxID=644383 RepID=UPI0010F45920|nr:hypothetical protein [Thermosporothrix hazakensis]
MLVGEPEKGLKYLEKATNTLDHKLTRTHCRLLMQQAEAYLAAGMPDISVDKAMEGLRVAKVLESTSNINWAKEIYLKIRTSPYKEELFAQRLRDAIKDK